MGFFDSESAFGQEDRQRRIGAASRFLQTREGHRAELEPESMARTAREAPPIEHWHHDLETVDILLDRHPPDIERARRMIDEVRREMYTRMR